MDSWDPERDGPGVVRAPDPLVRALEAASAEDAALLMIALTRSLWLGPDRADG